MSAPTGCNQYKHQPGCGHPGATGGPAEAASVDLLAPPSTTEHLDAHAAGMLAEQSTTDLFRYADRWAADSIAGTLSAESHYDHGWATAAGLASALAAGAEPGATRLENRIAAERLADGLTGRGTVRVPLPDDWRESLRDQGAERTSGLSWDEARAASDALLGLAFGAARQGRQAAHAGQAAAEAYCHGQVNAACYYAAAFRSPTGEADRGEYHALCRAVREHPDALLPAGSPQPERDSEWLYDFYAEATEEH